MCVCVCVCDKFDLQRMSFAQISVRCCSLLIIVLIAVCTVSMSTVDAGKMPAVKPLAEVTDKVPKHKINE